MKIRVYYNLHKGVFVAKRQDDTVVKISHDFGEVDAAAHTESSSVEYDIDSFPQAVKQKIVGEHHQPREREDFKTLFMKLIFSYSSPVPPDSITRALVRTLLKRRLRIAKVLTVDREIFVIALNREAVVFRLKEVKGVWRVKEVKNSNLLPSDVLKEVEKLKKKEVERYGKV